LKPANILLTCEGIPKIADFGLAKRLDVQSFTQAGALVGTPSYMAPEQVEANFGKVGPATDVWGLGVILYELVTGRPPFRAETPLDTLRHVVEHNPARPGSLNPNIKPDLEAICRKCLEKRPADRYASAQELADDLGLYLEGNIPTARPRSLLNTIGHFLGPARPLSEFTAVASLHFVLAAISFVGLLLVIMLIEIHGPEPLLWLALFSPYIPLFALYRLNRQRRSLPSSQAERQLWSVWIGHFLACAAVSVAFRAAAGTDYIHAIVAAFPAYAALTGLAFFVMGCSHWGRHYLFGLAFFVVSALLPFLPQASLFAFALLMGGCNLVTGLDLRKLAREMAKANLVSPQGAHKENSRYGNLAAPDKSAE
jgi:serine/threonine-protein kinase